MIDSNLLDTDSKKLLDTSDTYLDTHGGIADNTLVVPDALGGNAQDYYERAHNFALENNLTGIVGRVDSQANLDIFEGMGFKVESTSCWPIVTWTNDSIIKALS